MVLAAVVALVEIAAMYQCSWNVMSLHPFTTTTTTLVVAVV